MYMKTETEIFDEQRDWKNTYLNERQVNLLSFLSFLVDEVLLSF